MSKEINAEKDIHQAVREYYGQIADDFKADQPTNCGCGTSDSSCCGGDPGEAQLDQIAKLYQDPDALSLPEEITNLSLGCGDPITLAALKPGQTVLDLGSGGGIDCFLAANKVGETGKVIGVDMTPSMLDRARANKAKLGAENVEFRMGEIEHLPVEDNSVDVIISNCVINLSPDKPQVFREAFRVLKPGGKLAVSDIVTDGDLPEVVKQSISAWAGCIAGAWDVKDYTTAIEEAGFTNVEVQRQYWYDGTITNAVSQLDPEVQSQISKAGKEGRGVMLIQDGVGQGELIQLSDEQAASFDPEKAVFSARVTAHKPK